VEEKSIPSLVKKPSTFDALVMIYFINKLRDYDSARVLQFYIFSNKTSHEIRMKNLLSVVATVRTITIDERDGYCCREVAEFLKRMIFLAFRCRLFPFHRLMSFFLRDN